MKHEFLAEYRQKLQTPEEAAKLVRSGDCVFVGAASSITFRILDALWARKDELEGVELSLSNILKPTAVCGADSPFSINTPFLGPGERSAVRNGIPVNYSSLHLSQADIWVNHIAKPNVAFLEVSAPDENGYMSYGPSGGGFDPIVKEQAALVVAHVNRNVPYVYGKDNLIHVSEAAAIVEADDVLPEAVEGAVDDVSRQASEHILREVPDGATIQLGIGKLSAAIGYGLMQRNDLGIYTELFNDTLMHLMKNGNVSNAHKGYMDGVSPFAFAMGSRELYEFMDKNESLYCGSFPFINDPRNIAKNKKMISINSAMAIDLYGQVAADSMGWKQQSAVGGQVDFVKGAQWSEGGKSIIATASSFMKDGVRKSKIVLNFPVGTAVTTARSEVQYVATEYGCVNLKTLTMQDRVRAMISLAHPDFRDQLTDEAKRYHLI